jgi:CRP-like cAMP-binding protein
MDRADLGPDLDRANELLLRKLRTRDVVNEREASAIRSTFTELRGYRAGKTIVRAGVTLSECTLLYEGFVCRYKDLADGRRQILEIHVPGDYLDLHSFVLKRLEHDVGSLTPVKLAISPHDHVREVTEANPHLARLFWFSTLSDGAIHRERLLSVGRRSALARIAHLICELNIRLEIVGLAEGGRYALPLTQTDIADTTALTSVHVNRMFRKLRDDRLVTFRSGEVIIEDWEGLQRVAEFDPAYLYLERRPR